MRARCGRADLVRLLGAPDSGLLDRCAGLLGFERRPSPPERQAPELPLPTAPVPVLAGELTTSPMAPLAATSFLQVVASWTVETEEPAVLARETAPWERGERGDVLAFPEVSPMEPWPRLWRRLRPHLSELLPSAEVDVEALVRSLGRAETVTRLPRLSRSRFADRQVVVVDRARRQLPSAAPTPSSPPAQRRGDRGGDGDDGDDGDDHAEGL